jgi:hypothetical protein
VVIVQTSSSLVDSGHETIVRRDGAVTSGSEQVRISAAAVDQIEAVLDRARFKSLRPLYGPGHLSDAPTYTVTFRGRTVRFATGAAPPRLWAAVSQIEELPDEAAEALVTRVTVAAGDYLDVKLRRDGTAQISTDTSERTIRPDVACQSRLRAATAEARLSSLEPGPGLRPLRSPMVEVRRDFATFHAAIRGHAPDSVSRLVEAARGLSTGRCG